MIKAQKTPLCQVFHILSKTGRNFSVNGLVKILPWVGIKPTISHLGAYSTDIICVSDLVCLSLNTSMAKIIPLHWHCRWVLPTKQTPFCLTTVKYDQGQSRGPELNQPSRDIYPSRHGKNLFLLLSLIKFG